MKADMFAKDDGHPIPDLDVVDVHGELKDGGHDLVIVIASPLQADHRSQLRLREKVSRYLGFLAGLGDMPAGASKRIIVKIHRGSAPDVFELLERCRPWAEDNHVLFEVSKLT
jgi:hypothetical protein